MQVKIIQKGSGRGQGVGYADDGTMIVVEQSDRLIGQTLDVLVDRMHNTTAGKMIFAKQLTQQTLPNKPESRPKAPRNHPKPRPKQQDEDPFVQDLRRELR
jgi:hypothetical protein